MLTEWDVHGMRCTRNEMFTEWDVHGMRCSWNEMFTELNLHGMRYSLGQRVACQKLTIIIITPFEPIIDP